VQEGITRPSRENPGREATAASDHRKLPGPSASTARGTELCTFPVPTHFGPFSSATARTQCLEEHTHGLQFRQLRVPHLST
jgi:hypothetical protein